MAQWPYKAPPLRLGGSDNDRANSIFIEVGAKTQAATLLQPTYPETFGALGDGATDDTDAIESALSESGLMRTVDGAVYDTTLGVGALLGRITGYGQVKTSDGNKRAPIYGSFSAPPSSVGTHTSAATAFNGDLSGTWQHIEWRVRGATTLGQPATGFKYNEELSPFYIYMVNEDSGHNEGVGTPDGRTTWTAFNMRGLHYGQGGMNHILSSITVAATKGDATSFLACPASANINVTANAAIAGCYLNPVEINLDGKTHDVAGNGLVINAYRGNATGALGAYWGGVKIQSLGAEPLDFGYQITGDIDTGIDFTLADFSSDTYAAVALKANDRVYLNSVSGNGRHKTSNGGSWLAYNGSNSSVELFVGSNETLRLTATAARIRGTGVGLIVEDGNVNLLGAGRSVSFNSVVGLRDGTGSPEGLVNGPIGALYLRRDGGAGSTLYVKESGAGTNTGWVAK